jgi:hypothetical protein
MGRSRRRSRNSSAAESAAPQRERTLRDPLPVLAFLLCGLFPVVWLWPEYFLDPNTLPSPAREIVAWVAFAVFFSATSTLVALGYLIVFRRAALTDRVSQKLQEAADELMKTVLTYAGVGAVIGTLLGLRLAASLLGISRPLPRLMEYVGVLGNMITIFTLVAIAPCWGLVIHLAKDTWIDDRTHLKNVTGGIVHRLKRRTGLWFIAAIVFAWIAVGLPAGSAVGSMVLQAPATTATPAPAPASAQPTVSATPTRPLPSPSDPAASPTPG